MDNVVSLDQLFHRRVFQVPDYQRGYSWERQQISEFLEDLELLGDRRYHYTGTIVLHQVGQSEQLMDTDGNSYFPVDIVDGQQRLTTIVLLLDSISRYLVNCSDTAKGISQGIKRNFVASLNVNGQSLFKLSLNTDTDHFFKQSILSEQLGVEGPQITSERRLAEAKQQIASYLERKAGQGEGDSEEWLRALYSKLATKLRFTLYEVEDDAEVGVIFEVMNDRGKPLTNLEKVKNYLLYASTSLSVPNELAKSVNSAWAEILQQLMSAGLVSSADEDRLLRAHWLVDYNPQSRQWQGSRSVKEKFSLRNYVGRHQDFLSDLLSYTEGLRASCIVVCDAYNPDRIDAFSTFKSKPKIRAEVVEWSKKLRRTGFLATFLPLLIAVRRGCPDEPTKYLDILKLCEKFAFRVYSWNQYRSNAGQASLFRLANDLATKKKTYPETLDQLTYELASWCGPSDFHDEGPDGNAATWYSWSGLRYFLYEYESSLALQQGASPIVPWDELNSRDLQDTIEHILPQSIAGRMYWEGKFTHQQHGQYVHDLGNLTLTKHNSAYQNKPFPEKKGAVNSEGHCYAKSPLFVERELAQWTDWDSEAIDKRRSALLEWAGNRWTVEQTEISPETSELELGESDESYYEDEADAEYDAEFPIDA